MKRAVVVCLGIFLLFIHSVTQGQELSVFEKEWNAVKQLTEQRKPRAAVELVQRIKALALQQKQYPHYLKAGIMELTLMADYEEDFHQKSLDLLQQEILKTDGIQRAVLYQLKAVVLQQYLNQHSYSLNDRVSYDGEGKELAFWSKEKLEHEIVNSFIVSLEQEDILKNIEVSDYALILTPKEEGRIYRPNMFDLLGQHALEYINTLPEGVLPYEKIDMEQLYGAVFNFAGMSLDDDENPLLMEMSLYQRLIKSHMQDEQPDALVDLELNRLKRVFSTTRNSVMQSDSLYVRALMRLREQYQQSQVVALVLSQLAEFYYDLGSQLSVVSGDGYSDQYIKAVAVCKEAINNFPFSRGAKACKILLQRIEEPIVEMKINEVIQPEKPELALIKVKNVEKLWFRYVALSVDSINAWGRDNSQNVWEKFTALNPVKQWHQSLVKCDDYHKHAMEVPLPAMNSGSYVLLVSTHPDFAFKKSISVWQPVQVSNITWLVTRDDEQGMELFVLHRQDGRPLKGAAVVPVFRNYDYSLRRYMVKRGETFYSDQSGRVYIDSYDKSGARGLGVEISWKGDRVNDERLMLPYYHRQGMKDKIKTHFFTDRKLYRPGQTVWFKGLVIRGNGRDAVIEKNHTELVTFYDVNYKKISSQECTTNHLGSFSGSFVIPDNVLTGSFTVSSSTGSGTVRVESYQRPHFEVVFDDLDKEYGVGDVVNYSGYVQSFAGSAIEAGRVKYVVIRKVRFPWRSFFNPGFVSDVEVARGEALTDSEGRFDVMFKALPDFTVDRKLLPAFTYEVKADVTDINGETQSGLTLTTIGYRSLVPEIDVDESVNTDKKSILKLGVKNLNGIVLQRDMQLKISRLNVPQKSLRKRLWEEPDRFVLEQVEFKKLFPDDVYGDEDDKSKWNITRVVLDKRMNSAVDTIVVIDDSFDPGWYKAEVSVVDNSGNVVSDVRYFMAFSFEDKKLNLPENLWLNTSHRVIEPGEELLVQLSSHYGNGRIMVEITHGGDKVLRQWLKPNQKIITLHVPILEQYRGGLKITAMVVNSNRMVKRELFVDVPHSDKKLNVTFESFRSDLLPGSVEQWRLHVRNQKGEGVAAELLATMYDASLDAILPHQWMLALYGKSTGSPDWLAGLMNKIGRGWSLNGYGDRDGYLPPMEYDRLNLLGLNQWGGVFYRDRMMKSEAIPTTMQSNLMVIEDDVEEEIEVVDKEIENLDQNNVGSIRRDLRETAFFIPQLLTDEKGDALLSFTMPQSVTRWKMMGLAHTETLQYEQFEKELITSKTVMITPNWPRFVRYGDTLIFSATIANTGDIKFDGRAHIKVSDAISGEDVTSRLVEKQEVVMPLKPGTHKVSWVLNISHDEFQALVITASVDAGKYRDAEEKIVPVFTDEVLVTETLPMLLDKEGRYNFEMTRLKRDNLKNIRHHSVKVEVTSNPVWLAVQAMPYVADDEGQSSDAVFRRYYVNRIGRWMMNNNPDVEKVFKIWRDIQPATFQSALEKNAALKSIVVEQTPWLNEALDESGQRRMLAAYFDKNTLEQRSKNDIMHLLQMQGAGGAWSWYPGMPESRYVTQDIVTGMARLLALDVPNDDEEGTLLKAMSKAMGYLNSEMKRDYAKVMAMNNPDGNHLNAVNIQYLFVYSMLSKIQTISQPDAVMIKYYLDQADKYWNQQGLYSQAMLALVMHRLNRAPAARLIVESLTDRSQQSTLGMYWRDNRLGYRWYESPIATQALMVEVYDEVAGDDHRVDLIKRWLLTQKHTTHWSTSKATAQAVFALLYRGSDWISEPGHVTAKVGEYSVTPYHEEAGTGYFSKSWHGAEVKSVMGNVIMDKQGDGPAWGALYWQYFVPAAEAEGSVGPLTVRRMILVNRDGRYQEVTENTILDTGDQLIVRLEIEADRDMDFIHLRDMRSVAFEPVRALSGYQWRGGLGYYQSVGDASADFFFDRLPKGSWVFEYPLVATRAGDFSNGMASVQSMYAPEFSAHTKGMKVHIKMP